MVHRADGEAQHRGGHALQNVGHHQGVAQRLGHLLPLHGDPSVVHPQAGEPPSSGVGLSLLVFVVRETQVDATAVDVELLPQVAPGHGRALQVPAGAPATPRGIPRRRVRLGGFGSLPQGEIAPVTLASFGGGVNLVFVLGGEHVLQILVRERAVVPQRMHVEIDVPVAVRVGVAAFHQTLHEGDLVGDMRSGARFKSRRQQPQDVVGLSEFALEPGRPGPPRHPGLGGLVQDLVVNVGDVANVDNVQAFTAQPTDQGVVGHGGTQVPNVGAALHGGATQVDAHLPFVHRPEGLELAAGGVIQM